MAKPDKYFLYENAVQTPDTHVKILEGIYRENMHRYARKLREDFCGTYAICCEWVKRDPANIAVGLDLDPEPLAYGTQHHFKKLTPHQKKRLKTDLKNVLNVTSYKADLIIACNFSFFIFKDRKTLIQYFRSCLDSMGPEGMLVLETFGGPGAIESTRERKSIRLPRGKRYTYIWDQQTHNPITAEARFAIHFNLPDGTKMKNVFTYDWRMWGVPELKDALIDAGFDETCVYWETEHEGEATGEYVRTELGDNAYSWIAQVCGIKRAKGSKAKRTFKKALV